MENVNRKEIIKTGPNKPDRYTRFLHLLEVELNEKLTLEKTESSCISDEKANIKCEIKVRMVEEIKTSIHQLIYFSDKYQEQNISDYISKKVGQPYVYLNTLFSQNTGSTIKKYINTKKIELIKEILIYDEMNFETIVRKLNYRNAKHLTEEFRKNTGVSPGLYKLLRKSSSYKFQNV